MADNIPLNMRTKADEELVAKMHADLLQQIAVMLQMPPAVIKTPSRQDVDIVRHWHDRNAIDSYFYPQQDDDKDLFI